MKVQNPNQIAVAPDHRGLWFYEPGRHTPSFTLEFDQAWLALNAAADLIAVGQEMARGLENAA